MGRKFNLFSCDQKVGGKKTLSATLVRTLSLDTLPPSLSLSHRVSFSLLSLFYRGKNSSLLKRTIFVVVPTQILSNKAYGCISLILSFSLIFSFFLTDFFLSFILSRGIFPSHNPLSSSFPFVLLIQVLPKGKNTSFLFPLFCHFRSIVNC